MQLLERVGGPIYGHRGYISGLTVGHVSSWIGRQHLPLWNHKVPISWSLQPMSLKYQLRDVEGGAIKSDPTMISGSEVLISLILTSGIMMVASNQTKTGPGMPLI